MIGDPAGSPEVVAIGGGHGLASTLVAARRYAGRLTAVVSVADDGGSSGRLREIAGIPAPGDLRRCLVAMAATGSPWAPAFEYRFPVGSGDLAGHALGNLIIAGLANVTGDFGEALDRAAELLGTVGRVLPATSVPAVLRAEVAGREVVGQVNVSEAMGPITMVSITPADAPVPDEVVAAIRSADQVVLGPGSLFTSVLAACVVPGVTQALAATRAQRLYVANLHPQVPETEGFSLADHVEALERHGVVPDAVLVDGRGPFAGQGCARPVVRADLADDRGLVHDVQKLASAVANLVGGRAA